MAIEGNPSPFKKDSLPIEPAEIALESWVMHLVFEDQIDEHHLAERMEYNKHHALADFILEIVSNPDNNISQESNHAFILGASFAYEFFTTRLQRIGFPLPTIDEQLVLKVNNHMNQRSSTRAKAKIDLTEEEFKIWERDSFLQEVGIFFPSIATTIRIKNGPASGNEKGTRFTTGIILIKNAFEEAIKSRIHH